VQNYFFLLPIASTIKDHKILYVNVLGHCKVWHIQVMRSLWTWTFITSSNNNFFILQFSHLYVYVIGYDGAPGIQIDSDHNVKIIKLYGIYII